MAPVTTNTSAAASTADAPGPPPRLLDPSHLPVVAGTLALVTLAAFENRAVQTVLPVVVGDLQGWGLFGASTGASVVAFTLAMAFCGGWTDRFGPRAVLLGGMALFTVAQAVSGAAPTMAVFVAGRGLSGAAEALLDTSLMVLVAQALPEALRAKVFAGFAAAWVLPSLLGPGLAGGIEALAGWRAVFVGPVLVAAPALLLLRPALRRGHPGTVEADDGSRARTTAALTLAAGLAVVTFSAPLLDSPATRPAGVGLAAAGLAVVLAAATRALPWGTTRLAGGVPAVVGIRLLVSAAFTGVGMTIPLMLVTVHHASAALAGVSLSVTGVMWAVGSWLNSTDVVQRRTDAARRIRVGGLLIAVGAAGPALLSLDLVGVVAGMAGWALAATGMGILSPTLSTELLALTPPHRQGRASAAQGLAVSTGVAVSTGLAGAVVAWLGPSVAGPHFAALVGVGALTGLTVALAAGRVRALTPGEVTAADG